MSGRNRTVGTILTVVALLLGIGCLNYTAGHGAEHHRQWAERVGVPSPSPLIFYLGGAATILAAARLGFVIGRRRSTPTRANA